MSFAQMPSQFFMVRRHMTRPERDLAVKSVSQLRSAVQGLGFASIFVAAVSMTWPDGLLSLITISIMGATVALMAQYLAARSRLKAALVDGRVVDLRGVPQRSSNPRGWRVGPVSFASGPLLDPRIVEGRPATLACVPGMDILLSVDGVMLGGPVRMSAARTVWESAQERAAPAATDPALEEPPPPSD